MKCFGAILCDMRPIKIKLISSNTVQNEANRIKNR